MPINYGQFTDEEEQAAVRAIIAERDALRERVAALTAELDNLRYRAERPSSGPPEEIYLQWYGDDDGRYLWPDDVDEPCATWSAERIWPRDVRYIRAQNLTGLEEDIDKLRRRLAEAFDSLDSGKLESALTLWDDLYDEEE